LYTVCEKETRFGDVEACGDVQLGAPVNLQAILIG
jgi:hypothetical protein